MKKSILAVAMSVGAVVVISLSPFMSAQGGVDPDAAQVLTKKSSCGTCHAVDKEKSASSYKTIARKYDGKADAEDKLYIHLTTAPTMKVNGDEEKHKVVKSQDKAEIINLVRWILSQK